MQNGLMVLHGNRLETLTELVADWLQREPLPPLETETFLVQSNGMAQWLKLQLADALGISAGFQFQMPARFLWGAYRTVLGEDQVPRTSPFDKSRLLWRLYRLLPALLNNEHFGFAALHVALKEGHEKCLELLLGARAEVNLGTGDPGDTPLILAVNGGLPSCREGDEGRCRRCAKTEELARSANRAVFLTQRERRERRKIQSDHLHHRSRGT